MKTLFAFIIFICVFQISLGQEPPKAQLVNDYTYGGECDLVSQFEWFMNVLQKNEELSGYAVIHGNLYSSLFLERMILGTITEFGHKESKVVLLFGNDEDKLRVEFWMAQDKGELPLSTFSKRDLSMPNLTKAIKFYDGRRGEHLQIGIEKQIAVLMSSNPNTFGNFVIHESDYRSFLKSKKELIKEISAKYEIKPNRLRFFFVKEQYYSDFEFWLVPKKKRH